MGRAEKPSSVTRSEDERIENSPSEIRGRSLVRARSAKEITMKVIPSSIANPFIKAHHYSGKVVNNSKLHFGVFLDGQLHGVIRTLSPLRLGRSDGKRQAAERRGRACTGDDRILAAYIHPEHPDWKIWIITEWDRSATTLLFPDE